MNAARSIPPGGLLALDWGRKKVGYATGDETGLVVTPRGRFLRRDRRDTWRLTPQDAEDLRGLVKKYEPGAFILGLPLNADGTPSEASAGATKLADELRKTLGLEVFLVPEILTSWASRDESDEDAYAAALLIRDFLSSLGTS